MNKNPYENRRKYASMKGAFLGLLSTLPKDFDYRMTKGQGFAILANFPWLGYTRFICQCDKDEVWTSRHRSRSLGLKEIQLMTPRIHEYEQSYFSMELRQKDKVQDQ